MPVQLISAIGYVAAVIMAGLTLYHWRRSNSLYALLVEGANRYDELRLRGSTLEQAVQRYEDRIKAHESSVQRLAAQLELSRDKNAELVSRLEQQGQEHSRMCEKLEQQKGHLQQHVAIAQEAQRQAEVQAAGHLAEAEALRLEAAKDRRFAQGDKAAWDSERQLIIADFHSQLKAAEEQHQQTAAQVKTADPLELRRLKRKVAQYDRLYSSMKGLREMSEERNRNWEVALGRLAAWILEEKGVKPLPKAIGPLVGQALQAIGAQLIDDHEIMAPREGGELAAHMDTERELGEIELAKGVDVQR